MILAQQCIPLEMLAMAGKYLDIYLVCSCFRWRRRETIPQRGNWRPGHQQTAAVTYHHPLLVLVTASNLLSPPMELAPPIQRGQGNRQQRGLTLRQIKSLSRGNRSRTLWSNSSRDQESRVQNKRWVWPPNRPRCLVQPWGRAAVRRRRRRRGTSRKRSLWRGSRRKVCGEGIGESIDPGLGFL